MAGVVTSSWFLADAALAIGLTLTANGRATRAKAKSFFLWLNKAALAGKSVPQHVSRNLDGQVNTVCYNIVKFLMYFCITWTVLYHMINYNKAPRNSLINFLYVTYGFLTARITAGDLFLNEEKRDCWSYSSQIQHMIFPISLEYTKKHGNNLNKTQVRRQRMANDPKVVFHLACAVASGLGLVAARYVLGSSLLFLYAPGFLMFHRQLLLFLDKAYNSLMLTVFHNEFDPFFVDPYGIVKANEQHDYLGRQYHYFSCFFKPLEKFTSQKVFGPMRSAGYPVQDAKAATILVRGAVVTAVFFLFGMLDTGSIANESAGRAFVNLLSGVLPFVLYYSAHAAFAHWNHGRDDAYGESLVRLLTMIVEMELSAYLFYSPLMNGLANKVGLGSHAYTPIHNHYDSIDVY